MSLTFTRPEKSIAMTKLVYAMRSAMIDVVTEEQLNIAEAVNATAQLVASMMVGAYGDDKEREMVMSFFPDVVRSYYPQWERI